MDNDKDFKGAIKLVYWSEPNFGDMLSPYIIGRLSGKKIRRKLFNFGKGNYRLFLKYILQHKFDNIKTILFFFEKNLLGVGSIISCGNKHSVIWGSGLLKSTDIFHGGKILAVRGKYTNVRLQELGFKGCNVFGDPALLLPLLVKPSDKKNEIAIIPHWSETDFFLKEYGDKYKIIDLRTRDVESVISEITSCRFVLSTSLHGIIVSHAYGIPTLWIKLRTLENDDIKFHDYFSSVGIDIYEGFRDICRILESEYAWRNLFAENKKKSFPNIDITSIQKDLLRVAPFDIVENYKKFYE